MKKRRMNAKGFTVVEVLVATAILAIFVSMAVVGTSALFGTGEEMMAVAKAAVLGSDVMKTVTNEVRFGAEFSTSGSGLKYNSTYYGDDCEIVLGEGGQLQIAQTSTAVVGTGETPSVNVKYFNPLSSAAYDEVRIKTISFTVEESAKNKGLQIVSCTLSITSDGQNVLWEKTVTVVPLSQKAVV